MRFQTARYGHGRPAAPTTILYASLDRPNEKLIVLSFAADALRRGGAKRLILLAPYLCYMRQDAAFRDGEAISQKVIGALIAGCVDRVITVDAHLHRTPDIRAVFPGIVSDNLSAMQPIAETLRKTGLDPAAPSSGRMRNRNPWVAISPGARAHDVAQKAVRRPLRRNRIQDPSALPVVPPDRGRCRFLGGTMIACARTLAAAGAATIDTSHPCTVPARCVP